MATKISEMSKEDKVLAAKQFLGQLLADTADWGCTDTQYDLRVELTELLGVENVPKWISAPLEEDDDEAKS